MPDWTMRPTANAAAVTAMAIKTITSSMASPPEDSLRLEAMAIVSANSASPLSENHAATGPCKATVNWQSAGTS